ncbi:hypothetical protein NE237_023081 [Protea cynaroides]|uniref:Uncharacterized protein n=1 Tax=Protea cynaroides TaxID=273540 RepID=A0A9Q0HB24_9MAGN|nr:hypothetical protein NE237_023081 [Protea cynaroides]
MASSSIPLEVIDDDDDEFDWEEAVKEIDFTCQGAPASTSRIAEDYAHPIRSGPILQRNSDYELRESNLSKPKKSGGARQSTLDKFIGGANRRNVPEKRPIVHTVDDNDTVDELPCGVCIDLEAAKTWIYPVNVPLRDYQLSITKTALFTNTLVALPTGLGKTLIAAVVMYNYYSSGFLKDTGAKNWLRSRINVESIELTMIEE